jgi:hypothetical protein
MTQREDIMPLPNFMVIGAPKAGTTSLWYYIRQHPEVFPGGHKEPGYFWSGKIYKEGKAQTLESYEKLFEGSEQYQAVGDGSPTYLADEDAPDQIFELIPGVRLVAILRDPCARAFSEFVFQRMRKDEPEADFLDAIKADPGRPDGRRIDYVATGLYYRHLSRFLSVFPGGQVKILFNEDLKSDPQKVVREVFSFLGIDPDVPIDTDIELTVSGVPKIKGLHWLLASKNPIKRALAPLLPKRFVKSLRRAKNANLERQFMTPDERAALLPFFEEDVVELEKLLGRDLSHWRSL